MKNADALFADIPSASSVNASAAPRSSGTADDLFADIPSRGEVLEGKRQRNIETRSPVTRGIASGVDSLQALAGGGMALVGKAVGSEGMTRKGLEIYERNTEEASLNPSKVGFRDLLDDPSLENALEWGGYTLGNLLPSMAEAAGGAVVGSVAAPGPGTVAGGVMGRTILKKSIQKLAADMVERAAKKGIAREAVQEAAEKEATKVVLKSFGAKAGAVGATAQMESGGNFGEAVDQVGLDNASVTSALATGAASALLETAGGNIRFIDKVMGTETGKAARKALEKGDTYLISRIFKEAAIQAPAEAGQEMGQEFLSLVNMAVVDPQFSTLTPENAWRLAEAGAAGAVGGVAFGAATGMAPGRKAEPKPGKVPAPVAAAASPPVEAAPAPGVPAVPVAAPSRGMAPSPAAPAAAPPKPAGPLSRAVEKAAAPEVPVPVGPVEGETAPVSVPLPAPPVGDGMQMKPAPAVVPGLPVLQKGDVVDDLYGVREEIGGAQEEVPAVRGEDVAPARVAVKKAAPGSITFDVDGQEVTLQPGPGQSRKEFVEAVQAVSGLPISQAFRQLEEKFGQGLQKAPLLEGLSDGRGTNTNRSRNVGQGGAVAEHGDSQVDVPGIGAVPGIGGAEPASGKSPSDGPISDAEVTGKALKRPSGSSQGDSFVKGPLGTDHLVMPLMASGRHEGQVVGGVVEPVSVDVVNDLPSPQGATKDLLHDKAMFEPLASDAIDFNADKAVTSVFPGEESNVSAVAGASHGKNLSGNVKPNVTGQSSKEQEGKRPPAKLTYPDMKQKAIKAGLVLSPKQKDGSFIISRDGREVFRGKNLEGVRDHLAGAGKVIAADATAPADEPAVKESLTVQPAAEGVTYAFGTAQGGIEVRFKAKPSAETVSALKRNGFRWSPRQKLWYAKDTPGRRAFIEREFGKKEEAKAPVVAPERAPEPEKVEPEALGVNRDGNPVFEDENGNRFYREDGRKVQAPVRMSPGGVGVDDAAALFRKGRYDFLTAEEFAGFRQEEDKAPEPAPVPAPAPKPAPKAQPAGYGAENKVFTADAAEKARALLRAKLSQVNSGLDPEILQAGIALAGYHVEAGARSFIRYAKAMVDDIGAGIVPYLKPLYKAIAAWPGLDKAGMDSDATVDAINLNDIIEEKEEVTTDAADDLSQQEAGAPSDDRAGDDKQGAEAAREPEEEGGTPGVSVAEGSGDDAQLSQRGNAGDDALSSESGTDSPRAGAKHRRGQPKDVGGDAGHVSRVSRDYRIDNGELSRDGGWKTTASRNLDIVALVKTLEQEKRQATPEEQALLVKYTGWGASEIRNKLFPGYSQHRKVLPNWATAEWRPLVDRLTDLLTEEELKTAARSTQYAHYTSEAVIRSIYQALDRFGFSGGKVLEPGMGVGHFWGLMPEGMRKTSRYTGVEMDHLTSAIAAQLYPGQNILRADFTKQRLPDNFFDLAIGNPPFASITITDDPAYKKHRFSLHDYFFAKSLDKVRPGGLMVFITSRYTMDKLNDKARSYLAERADLVGAIRLPQTAFKENAGTEVVTDVLFLRKRAEGEQAGGEQWLGVDEVQTTEGPALVNEYFARNPEMVLGRHSLQGSMYRDKEYTVLPPEGDIEQHFSEAVARLPEKVYSSAKAAPEQQRKAALEREFNPLHKKEGGIYLSTDKRLMVVDQGSGVPLSSVAEKLTDKDAEWLRDYVGLRDAVKQAQYDQLTDGEWEKSLKALNKVYSAFTAKHGRVLEFTTYERTAKDEDGTETTTEYRRFKYDKLLFYDVESPLVLSLEKIKEDGTIVNAPFLEGRSINKPTQREIHTLQDALAVSLDQNGALDLDHVASIMSLSRDEVIEGLGDMIFQAPGSDAYQLADEYLSGDVVKKLEEAQAAAAADEKYRRNVEALEKVQPTPLTVRDVTVILGANWIEPKHIEAFAQEVMDEQSVSVSYNADLNHWTVAGSRARSYRTNTSDWGTDDKSVREILEAVLNNNPLKVQRTDSQTKKTFTDDAATAAVNEIAKKMRERFGTWVWTDSERAAALLETYNRRYNNIAPRKFDGSHLTLPGVSMRYKLHPHQKRAIWRIVQAGNTYLAHAVGAGKTIEMVAAGMEMRRLGLVKKPLYVVPNHMLQQFANEFMELYPAANIMVADERNFHTTNRRRFMAQAALNDPDAIIITHSALGKLGMKEESVAAVREEFLDDLRSALEEVDESEGRYLISRMEKRIEQAERRFDSMVAGDKADSVLTFEELGVDFLVVDEVHEFRKLDFTTNRQVKGIDPNGSRKALDLYIKVRYLAGKNPGRSHVFASGTPVTNTMGELYSLMRFFSEEEMRADGIGHFDAWANMFGLVNVDYEMNAAGRYEPVERFSKFVNVPELMKRVRMFMDVLTSSQLGAYVTRPDIKSGTPEIIVAPASEELKRYQKEVLEPRIKAAKEWKPSKEQPGNPDPLINIITDGRLASIDMRFVDRKAKNDPDSKLNKMVDDIIRIHKETAQMVFLDPETEKPDPVKGAAQIVFFNTGFGEQVAANRGFNARAWIMKRLAEAKIPAEQVAWIEDYNTAPKKEAMFREMRRGTKRILFGSAKKMGTGVNVQRRLYAHHYLDPPWYPADVEQPDGRIIRQGNQNKEVVMQRYATKGSYDSTMWQMVSRKSRFIEQAFMGDDSMRTMDDVSESSQYAMASALASGDERVIELAGLSADVERLSRLQEAHAQEQINLRSERGRLEWDIDYYKKRLAQLRAAHEKVGGYVYKVDGQVDGARYDKHGEFGEAVIAAYNRTVVETVGKNRAAEVSFATVNGISIVADVEKLKGSKDKYNATLRVRITPAVAYSVDDGLQLSPDTDAVGLARKIINRLNEPASDIRDVEGWITEKGDRLKVVVKRIGAPFEYAKELVEKIAEKARLQQELAAEGQEVPADDTLQAMAPEEIDIEKAAEEEAGEAPKFAQKGKGKRSAPLSDVEFDAVFQRITGRLGKADGFVIAPTARDLPPRILAEIKKQGNDPEEIDGVFHRGKVYLVRKHITSAEMLEEILFHEWHGHAGLKAMFGRELTAKMVELYNLVTPGRLYAIGRKYDINLMKYGQALAKAGYDLDTRRAIMAEEMLAHLTREYSKGTIARKVREVIGQIRAWLREHGFAKLSEWGETDIAFLLKKARAYAETGAWAKDGDAVVFNGAELLQKLREAGITEEMLAQVLAGPKFAASEKQDQTTTEAFRKWFGDSKVVDEDGKPLRVYHGTAADISHFDRFLLGGNTDAPSAKGAFFFSDSPKVASGYAALAESRPSLRLKEIQKASESPVLDAETRAWLKEQLDAPMTERDRKEWDTWGRVFDENGRMLEFTPGANVLPVHLRLSNPLVFDFKGEGARERSFVSLIEEARKKGHDGVIFRNSDDSMHKDYAEVSNIYAVFNPTQIKSAIGNRGTFDPGDPDIRFSMADNARAARDFLKRMDGEAVEIVLKSLPDVLPERVKSAVGKVLSNPHYSAKKSKYRQAVYDLNLERNANANEIKVEIMARDGDYEGLEGVREGYRKATREEREMADRLVVESDIRGEEYSAEDLDGGNNPLGKAVPEVVKKIYLAVRQTVAKATEVMFDRLGRLRLLPYEGTEYYQELIDLLDEDLKPEEVARRFGIHEKAVDAYAQIQAGKKKLDALTSPYRKQGWYSNLREALEFGLSGIEVQNEYGKTPELVEAFIAIKRELAGTEIMTAEKFKKAQWYGTLLDLLRLGDDHPMLQKLELYNAYLGVKQYDSQLAEFKKEWGTLVGYFPRIRRDGEWHVKVYQVNEDGTFAEVFMQPTKTRTGAKLLEKDVRDNLRKYIPRNFDENAQYRVVHERNTATPEEIFQSIGSHRAIEALLSKVFNRATDAGVIKDPREVHREVLRILSEEIAARGFQRHKLHRAKHLIEGYETRNIPALLAQFVGGEAGWLSKTEFAMRANKAMSEVPDDRPEDKDWVHDYVDDALKNSTYVDQILGTARAVVSLMFLGFKVSSAALNGTQNYIWGQAVLSRYTKGAVRRILKAQSDVLRDHFLRRAGKPGILLEDEAWAMEQGSRRGRTNANFVRAMAGMDDTGGVMGGLQSGIRSLTDKAMLPFQMVETYWNREPMLLAAFRVFKEQGMSREEALKKAEGVVDDSHFVIGKENIPALLRKMGPFGRLIYTFQSFTHNYLLGMFHALKGGEIGVVVRSLTALMLFGGVAALPFGDDLDKWYRRLFGERPLRMLERWLRETGGEYTDFGDQIADFVMHGAPALAGVNFSGALAVRIPWFSPEDDSVAERFTGVWGGLAKKVMYAGEAVSKGDIYRATEFVSPEALANAFRGYRHYADGATTLSGRPVFGDDGKQVRYSAGEAMVRALGFMPLEPSKQSQNRWDARRAKDYWSERKADVLALYRTSKDKKEAMRAVREFNRELRESPSGVLVPPITVKTLRQAKRAKPDKREMAYLRD